MPGGYHFCDCASITEVMQASVPITTVKTFADRLLEAMADAKMSQAQLAAAAGYTSQGSIGNVIARNKRPKRLREVAIALGVREEWLETGSLPKRVADQAHPVSQETVTSPLQRAVEHVIWGDLGMRQLPEAFTVDAPDDSMAPVIRRGMRVEFDKTLEPGQEDIVLLHDGRGDWYIRNYVPVTRERWKAKPQNSAAADDMDSVQDELTVIAVLTNVQRRRP